MVPLLFGLACSDPSPDRAESARHSGGPTDTAPDSAESGETDDDTGGESGESGDSDTSPPPDDRDGDGALTDDDCDDTNPSVHPGASEACDGVDEDCDGVVDDACTTSLRGDYTVDAAQATVDGPCVDANWGELVTVLDLDGDGYDEVVSHGWCDGHYPMVGTRDAVSGVSVVDMAADSVLRVPGWVEGYAWFRATDVNRDGRREALARLTLVDDPMRPYNVQLYREPSWGMTTDDADLTVFLVSQSLYGGGQVWRDEAAVIPGDPGVLAYSGTWLGDYDYCDADVFLIAADETGTYGTNQLDSLGPYARFDWDCQPPSVSDAGDLDGDGENELFLQVEYSDDLYLGPFTPDTGERIPDIQLGGKSPGDYDYYREDITSGIPADLDGDGREELLLTGSTIGIRRAAYDAAGVFSIDLDVPLVVMEDSAYAKVRPLDANGDGALDLALSIDNLDIISNANGAVYIEYGPFHGARELGSAEGARILGEVENGQLGNDMAVSDLNGDGFDDLVVGSGLGTHHDLAGTLWTFLGGP